MDAWDFDYAAVQSLVDENASLKVKLQEVYKDRNLLVQLAAFLAIEVEDWADSVVGYGVGVGDDPSEPGWPVVYIETPEGQLSWHVPKEEVILPDQCRADKPEWDGHTTEEKQERIRRLLREY